MVRRTLAEVNAVLAGITFVATFARFSPPMATFSEERTLSLPSKLGRWELPAMADTQSSWEKMVRYGGCEKES